ncbi:enamine deaminase RidA (YjgF/YER057c/UK114 family) [Parabacteroides sp. PF5-5]|uniref:chorismate transformation enzyme, FkbO/Hyg5 family n=1 Tax=unclassified Parabacteroides TaxID=2649774 RepID=UPI002475C2D7|nr:MULTISPECIES: endoribonuclease L-PSP [unclassified Parabacteroides]MDH6303856.1 enamine deaminase RidA (YjgF/YER057c/UK114 family) [Parabacteroides sp. PH5-39]MDH6314473.1 enamine deaminase RidA (YjgF/YER057c/UK114 family) [Parabacteroides sp. PF5-13]MDH6318462.1 enamine deaminase RidA (YjgF/YER057c/UK114 family) [Parabacteroides sp. PH5-13]MDH6322245.1 enamine deaminase RidA (YjgF/YER057c/UK114 family) [Parabacteroides sp. PH5-8]MDH6325675.1 enamine deaminase RidA (YjgF/YER057c/UK114 famil
MNYCDKIKYRIYSTEKADFPLMVENLLKQLPEGEAVLRLAFLGTPTTNEEYITRRSILWEKVSQDYGENKPCLSYVSQPPLNASLILEVHSYIPEAEDTVSYRQIKGHPYVVLENTEGRFLFAGGFQTDVIKLPIEVQSVEVFKEIDELLQLEGFLINSIIRQWNYIEQITAYQNDNQNYQSFNNARGDFYAKTDWPNGYPAATGIGANLGGILVDLDAAVFKSESAFATPIDNKLQVAAHAYSEKVLEHAQKKKATPKFERAKSMTFADRRLVYISGTAAIRGEESLKGVGLERQLHITMENIGQLTGGAPLVMLRVYLKDKSDYELSKQLMDAYNLQIPISYMCADVCRDELLIEIEGIAIE